MIKEYRTIAEIAGPLMVVRQVERATFDELLDHRTVSIDLQHLSTANRSV